MHDDVLDDAETRRGVSSLNARSGNKLAILAGDFLLARASVSLASLQDTNIVALLSQARRRAGAGWRLARLLPLNVKEEVVAKVRCTAARSHTAAAMVPSTVCNHKRCLTSCNTRVSPSALQVLEHLVSGEIMQMTSTPEQLTDVEHYLTKTFNKTASLMANSAKARVPAICACGCPKPVAVVPCLPALVQLLLDARFPRRSRAFVVYH